MNRSRTMRAGAAIAVAALAALGIAGCSPEGGSGEDVTITWWHNGTGDPLNGFWEEVASEFEAANPGVTVDVQAYQNEDLQSTVIPNALRSGDAPDLFQQWGGGEMAAQVDAGYLRDLTDDVAAELDLIGGTASPWQLGGRTYGLPFTFGIAGYWYNTELFAEAGVEVPETLDELYDVIDTLKGAGIAPISVGAGDGWPAGFYFMYFTVKSCSPAVLEKAQVELVFDDPCFVAAGEQLEEFLASQPFNEGYLATPAQQGAGSSAGLLANGQVAMELMGHWNSGVIGGLTADGEVPSWLGWFPFPGVSGAAGDPTAALGGGDGFSISADAPDATVDLLKYIVSPDVQKRFAETGAGIPVTKGSESGLSNPNLIQIADGLQAANYVQLWLDVAYGPTVGGAMTEAVLNVYAGTGSAADIVAAMKAAADTL